MDGGSGKGPEGSGGNVEFFGVKLKVSSPHLAALLNSDVTEDVQVVGRRAREAFAGPRSGEAAEREVERRLSEAEAPVQVVHRSVPD